MFGSLIACAGLILAIGLVLPAEPLPTYPAPLAALLIEIHCAEGARCLTGSAERNVMRCRIWA